MQTLTAEHLLTARRAELLADRERMSRRPPGVNKADWREANPIDRVSYEVRDLRYKTRPHRTLIFDLNGSLYDVWIWGKRHCILRIDLRAPNADAQLAQFEIVSARAAGGDV